MSRTLITGMLALGLVACTSGAAKEPSDSATTKQVGTVSTVRRERTISARGMLPNGTQVRANIQDSLTSRINKVGQTLTAIVSADVLDTSGDVVVPAASTVVLTIDALEPGSDPLRPEGRLSLVVSSLRMYGHTYPLTAALEPVPHHLLARGITSQEPGAVVRSTYRDVIVSAGTPIVFTLTQPVTISSR